jgi:pimeloyl-ACP methyl ester carboxylesterase
MRSSTTEVAGASRTPWTEIDWASRVNQATVGGRRVQYLCMGSGTPIVFVHGLGGSWQSWILNLADLATDHLVIAIDLPGFGGSEELPPPAEMATHAEIVTGLLDELRIARAVLVAHSMGGLVCVNVALSHPDRIIGLVLVDAGGVALSPRHKAIMLGALTHMRDLLGTPAILQSVISRPRLRRAALAGGIGDPATIDAKLAYVLFAGFAAPGFPGAVAAGIRDEIHTRIGEVAAPALLIWGERDRLVPAQLGRAMAAAMPDARIEVLPGVGHCPMLERPERFNVLVRDAVQAWGQR